MIFTLARLVTACEDYLLTQEVDTACQNITKTLAWYLRSAGFVKDTIPDEINGRHTAYERYKGLTVLAHHHPKPVASKPHDHGCTWAIYGVGAAKTAMYDWELVEPAKDGQRGKVKLKRSYWIMPGMASYFPQGVIRSHQTYDGSKLIRIEGMNIRSNRFTVGGKYFEPISTEVDSTLGSGRSVLTTECVPVAW